MASFAEKQTNKQTWRQFDYRNFLDDLSLLTLLPLWFLCRHHILKLNYMFSRDFFQISLVV